MYLRGIFPFLERKEMNLSVKVIGAGGIGSCLLPTLARLLNYSSGDYKFATTKLTIIDGDVYEPRNSKRQAFGKFANKAMVTCESLKKEYGNVEFDHQEEYVHEDTISDFIEENDIVFLCVDNHATRSLVSKYCEKNLKDVVLISGGNEITDGNVMVFHRKNGKNLTMPLHSKYHEEINNPNDAIPEPEDYIKKSMDCSAAAKVDPQLLIANFSVANSMLCAFHGIVSNGKVDYDEVYFDINANAARPVKRG